MTDSADQAVALTNKLIDACRDAVVEPSEWRPATIYHLSDIGGMTSIVSSRSLRASLATASNDASEMVYGADMAKAIIDAHVEADERYESALSAYLLDPTLAPVPDVQHHVRAFVASFCETCDKSGQWLHYGRSGRGAALGFTCELAEGKYDLVKVDYDAASQARRMAALIEVGRLNLREAGVDPSGAEDAVEDALVLIAAHIVSLHVRILSASFKHPSFADEQEWRLVGIDARRGGKQLGRGTDDIDFHVSGARLVPFETLSFADKPHVLQEVVLGYSSEVSEDAVELLLGAAGIDVRLTRSRVPVR